MERGGPCNRTIRSLVAMCSFSRLFSSLSLILSSSVLKKSKVWRVQSLCFFVFRKHFARVCVNTGRRRERRKSDPPKLSHCVGKFSGCRCASDSSLKTNTDARFFTLFLFKQPRTWQNVSKRKATTWSARIGSATSTCRKKCFATNLSSPICVCSRTAPRCWKDATIALTWPRIWAGWALFNPITRLSFTTT